MIVDEPLPRLVRETGDLAAAEVALEAEIGDWEKYGGPNSS